MYLELKKKLLTGKIINLQNTNINSYQSVLLLLLMNGLKNYLNIKSQSLVSRISDYDLLILKNGYPYRFCVRVLLPTFAFEQTFRSTDRIVWGNHSKVHYSMGYCFKFFPN